MEKSVLQLCKQRKMKKNNREIEIGVFVENAKIEQNRIESYFSVKSNSHELYNLQYFFYARKKT